MGTPKTKRTVAALVPPTMDKHARPYPRKNAPDVPIIILAGEKL